MPKTMSVTFNAVISLRPIIGDMTCNGQQAKGFVYEGKFRGHSPFMIIFPSFLLIISNPIPFIPFPLPRGRGRFVFQEGLTPLLNSPGFGDRESVREAKPQNRFIGRLRGTETL